MKNLFIIKSMFSFLVILLLLPGMLSAIEFNLAANINAGYGNSTSDEDKLDYKADIMPRFFSLLGRNSEFILSAGFSYDPELDFEYYVIPELLHTEFTFRFGKSGFRFGRFYYSDPLSFIFEGLFDGAQFFNISKRGSFNIGAWYTGYLYKNRTIIEMTPIELINNSKAVDIDNLFDTYFAPHRLIGSIGWEHPSIGEFMHLNTALIGQFDFTGSAEQFNTQYLILKARFPINNFIIEIGGSLENIMQNTSLLAAIEDNPFNPAFAGEIGFLWLFPGVYNSRLSLTGKFAGGKIEDICDVFVPITSKDYGYILKHKMSGLSVLMLNYSNRLGRTLGMSLTGSYFVRNDLGTFYGYPLIAGSGSEGFFLGPEFTARFIWSPVSDLQFNLGGGAFIPSLGDAEPNQEIKWRVDLTTTLAF